MFTTAAKYAHMVDVNLVPATKEATMATITLLERRTRPASAPALAFDYAGRPAVEGWFARVELAEGARLEFSKLDGEAEWTADAAFSAGCSMPAFMHGFGSRCTIPRRPAADVALLLDAGVADAES